MFARNLRDLLLAAPAGPRATLGLDPGIRTGVKAAVVDATGKLVDTATVYPFQPRNDVRGAQDKILELVRRYGVELIAIGNGTASRETERLVADAIRLMPDGAPRPTKVIVSEAGASVYSASELASKEFPDLDVSLRGAVSIARRLQDPLAELVKIEPKSIGVGQYQHDVDQNRARQGARRGGRGRRERRRRRPQHRVGAACWPQVAGLGPSLAQAIVTHRDTHGAFATRKALMKVSGLGPKAFEQCAGFLRIHGRQGAARRVGRAPRGLRAGAAHRRGLRARYPRHHGQRGGAESAEPEGLRRRHASACPPCATSWRSWKSPAATRVRTSAPRASPTASTRSADLKPGMMLEGTVTNVAAFGAFVDVGVHQDGLVHISQLADRFVKDPHEVVKAGDVVNVRVMEVDVPRKRIGLSMRKDAEAGAPGASGRPARGEQGKGPRPAANADRGGGKGGAQGKRGGPSKGAGQAKPQEGNGALGAALLEAMKKSS